MPVTRDQNPGYIESAQQLVHLRGRQWDAQELLRAAEAAELRNTGWPIGLVLHHEGMSPVPTSEGIEARLGRYRTQQWEDYWTFRTDGSYYVVRLFEENFEPPNFTSSAGHPNKSLWFDIRIWRITEALLHSATLYKELGLPPDEPYLVAVNHGGLSDREFYTSTPRRSVRRGRFSRTDTVSWTKEVTQDYVSSNIRSLVGEVASGLFVVFDFADVSQPVVDEIVSEFTHSRV